MSVQRCFVTHVREQLTVSMDSEYTGQQIRQFLQQQTRDSIQITRNNNRLLATHLQNSRKAKSVTDNLMTNINPLYQIN